MGGIMFIMLETAIIVVKTNQYALQYNAKLQIDGKYFVEHVAHRLVQPEHILRP